MNPFGETDVIDTNFEYEKIQILTGKVKPGNRGLFRKSEKPGTHEMVVGGKFWITNEIGSS